MIQIVTNREQHFRGWSIDTVSSFGSPRAFDTYSVNLIDLADEAIWRNNGGLIDRINIANDLRSLNRIIEACNKAKCVIVFPQNCYYRYGSGSGSSVKLKDILEQVRSSVLEPLIPLRSYAYSLLYENNVTHIGKMDYESAFYFDRDGYSITCAKDNGKATTVRRGETVYFTTLDIFESKEKLLEYLNNISLLPQERSEYPEWLLSVEMFDDAELKNNVDTCECEIETLTRKKEEYINRLDENQKYKSILVTSGDELVEDVFRILEQILSCDLSKFIDEKKEDFRIDLDMVTLIGEIKGVSSNIRSEHISQVDVHYQGYLDEQQEKGIVKAGKPILIMNPFRNKPVDQREPVHENQIKLALRNDCLIIETITLLRIFERFRREELTTERIINVFSNSSGLLQMGDFDVC